MIQLKSSGYNPLRWDCEVSGCFNTRMRPKIEEFADCFPGKINFGDVDGLVEIGGFFLLLEWKSRRGMLRQGQQLTYSAFTKLRKGNAVLVVEGDAAAMIVSRYLPYWDGVPKGWRGPATLADLKTSITRWANWATTNRMMRR